MLWLLLTLHAAAAPPSLGGVTIDAPPPSAFRCYEVNTPNVACQSRKVDLGEGLVADAGLELCGPAVHKVVFSVVYTPSANPVGMTVVADPKASATAAGDALASMLSEQGYAVTGNNSSFRNASQGAWSVSVLTMKVMGPAVVPAGSWQASAILQRNKDCAR